MAAVIASAGTKQIISGLLSPTQLPGLQIWLDGADPLASGTPPANGTVIPTWFDKSGYRRNGISTGSPTYNSSSRSISFSATQYETASYSGQHPVETAFFIVNITNPATTNQFLISVPSTPTGTRQFIIFGSDTYFQISPGGGAGNIVNYGVTLPTATNIILGYTYNSSSTLIYQKGVVSASTGAGVNPVSDVATVFGSNFTGTISEILVYNQLFSTVQRQAIEGYLAWKWNLVSTLPAGHPFLTSAAIPTSISTTFFPSYMPGLQLWMDAMDPNGTGTPPANGATLTTVADKSGNSRTGTFYNRTYTFTQLFTGTNTANATYTSGTYPYITPNFAQNSFLGSFIPAGTFLKGASIFFVYNSTNTAGPAFTRTIAPASGQAGNFGNPIEQQGSSYYIGANNAQTFGVSPYTPYKTTTFINNLNINQSPQSISVFSNGSSLYSSTGTWTASDTGNFLTFFGRGDGGSGIMSGNMNEILVYNSILTSGQRQVIEGYLAWKWNIQASLASNHPFRYFIPTSLSVGALTNYNYSTSVLPGLTAWYDALDPLGTGFQVANGTVISNWADKAGESLNPMISTGSPTYTTGSQNGLPGITVSGNSGITITNYFQAQVIPGTFSAQLDAFVVYKNTSAVTYNALISRSSSSASYNAPLDIYDTAIFAGNYPSSYVQAASSFNVYNTATSIFNVTLTQSTAASSKVTSYRNGTAATLTGSSTGWTPGDAGTHLYLGTRGDKQTGFNGIFYEVMVFNFPLSTGGRQYVEGYLAWKWGLQASLPTTHPYYLASPNIATLYFQPTQIVGLNLWLDGADPLNTGAAPANGATITTWFDKSPNAFSVASVGSPTYALATRNITMNGTSQGFSYTYSGVHPTETGFFVVNMTTPNSFTFYINSSGTSYSRQFYNFNTTLSLGQTNIGTNATTTSIVTANSNTMLGYSLNSTASFFYFNGTSGPTGTGFSSLPSESTIYIGYGGSGQYLAGTLSEVILFNKVLTTTERQTVEGYLAWKWGIQASLAATHPYKTVQPSLLTFVPSYTSTSNIAANAASYLPLFSNTIDYGNAGQSVGSNGSLSFTNILGKNCIYINNSTANYVSLPIANINVFTMGFWFNYINTTYYTVASYTTPTGTTAIQVDLVSAGSNTVYTALPNQWTNSPGSTNLGVNTWNFIAFTVNQNTFVENVYMNGVLASTATGTGAFPGSPSLMVLGKSGDGTVFPSGGARSFNGYLQNFMYFNTILTAAQIASIYEQTAQDLTVASQPTSLSLSFTNPTLSFSWAAGTNTTSYLVSFYGVATNTRSGGLFLASFSTTSTNQTYNPGTYSYYYATVTPTNSGFLGTMAISLAVQRI